jgi:tubulin--tyrosine ligase
MKIGPEEGC